jgi:glycosyltransferase involved in cell wall biosynthesis
MTEKKGVSVVVTLPALNEEATIAEVIAAIPQNMQGVDSVQALVVDDGSTDATVRCATEAGAHVFSFTHNRGLGAAFAQGIRSALALGADIIVNIDADGQFNPADIPKLLEPIIAGRADMVTASRFADPKLIPDMPQLKKWGNRRFARLITRLTHQKLHDVSCGFRAYSRDAALRTTLLGGHTYTHEVILDLAFRQLRIVEVPIKVIGVRPVGKSRVAGNLWKYGWNSISIICRAYRDYKPMQVFGTISALFFILALVGGVFVMTHYFRTGAFSPYIFVAFLSGGSAFIALICSITGLLAGMINRIRILQDEQLFLIRKQEYRQPSDRQNH